MKYAISFKNVGYAPATHLRLTMSYPGVLNIRTIIVHEDENMTVKNDSQGRSVVAFLPRVTSGGSISANTSIYRSHISPPSPRSDAILQAVPPFLLPKSVFSFLLLPTGIHPLSDFGSNISSYPHYEPYSIIATYDQGSSKFNPPSLLVNGNPIDYNSLNLSLGLSLGLFVLAFLSFAIAFRHKRRSKSKFASDILIASYVLDTGSIFLLAWIAWRRYMKHKV